MESNEKACPYCAEFIKTEAVKCRYCGEFFDEQNSNDLSALQFRYFVRGISTALSVVWPGLGQMFQGRLPAGIAFFLAELLVWLIWGIVIIGTADNRNHADQGGFIFWLIIMGIIRFFNILDAHIRAPGPKWDQRFRDEEDIE